MNAAWTWRSVVFSLAILLGAIPASSFAVNPPIKSSTASVTVPKEKTPTVASAPHAAIPTSPAASGADNGAPEEPLHIKRRDGHVAEPTKSQASAGTLPFVSVGDYVIIRINGLLQTAVHDGKVGAISQGLGLFINDKFFKDFEPSPVPGRENAVMFRLKHTDVNSDAWSFIFARTDFTVRDNTCSEDSPNAIRLAVGYDDGRQISPSNIACLRYFPDPSTKGLALGGAAALILATIFLAMWSSMLRDAGLQPKAAIDRAARGFRNHPKPTAAWSLARCQMALWFVTILSAVLYLYAVTGEISTIPQGALVLMGIGAGTAVSAFAIDSSATPGSKADYDALVCQQPQLIAAVKKCQVAYETALTATPNDPALDGLSQSLDAAKAALDKNIATAKQFEAPQTKNFIHDILRDGNGVAFHRLQILAWTLTYWSFFVAALFHKGTMIDFTTTQLALMGISGATYLGFKLSAQPKQADATATPPAAVLSK